MARRASQKGFTLIELLVAIAVAVVLISLAAPSFRGYTAKKKVEGQLAELATDIQFARSEAVSRNQNVRMSFGTNCYVIHIPATSTANSACAVSGGTNLRTVQVEDTSTVTMAPTGALTDLIFDTVRGEATLGGLPSTDTQGSVDVQTAVSISSPVRLRAVISKYGRVQICSSNSVAGYSACV
jgi:type IV fimbrial biogenesis protein FimT